jgi:hypothetical protein
VEPEKNSFCLIHSQGGSAMRPLAGEHRRHINAVAPRKCGLKGLITGMGILDRAAAHRDASTIILLAAIMKALGKARSFPALPCLSRDGWRRKGMYFVQPVGQHRSCWEPEQGENSSALKPGGELHKYHYGELAGERWIKG